MLNFTIGFVVIIFKGVFLDMIKYVPQKSFLAMHTFISHRFRSKEVTSSKCVHGNVQGFCCCVQDELNS